MSFVDQPTPGQDRGMQDAPPSVMEIQAMGLEESTDDLDLGGVVSLIRGVFNDSVRRRYVDETRWLECFRNYRGVYGSSTQFTDIEKSRAFIKITKTKVQAAIAQIADVLFAGNKFPIGVQALKIPLAVPEALSFDPKAPPEQEQPQTQGTSQMAPHIAKLFGPKKPLLDKVSDTLKEGTGLTPTAVIFDPNEDAARKMEKKILDQLDEADATKSLRSLVTELCLFGTGIYKGPFALDKEYPKWDEQGQYTPSTVTIPQVEYVSIWDAYPDTDARNMHEVEKFVQRHRLSKTQLRALKKRPLFRSKNIESAISDGPNYVPQWWESNLRDDSNAQTKERWEVLEFWGMIDKKTAEEADLTIPKEYKNFDEVQVNAWISGNHILRLVINPFKPARIPYYAVPYEVNPYSFFGIGVAENMMDFQLLMNGFMRLAVDNAALSSNIIFEVNEDMLQPGQSMDIYPGKVFRRQAGMQGKAVESTKFDNVTQETMILFDKARQLADEATGMPSFSHGITDVMSTGKTAAGMSMLMGAAAQNIKAVVRNLDDYLLAPLGKDLFSFNMQFNFDKDYIGDVTVVAKGTESLMRNEVRSQKLLQFSQFAAGNQMLAPYVKWDYILREFTASLDLDEDDVVNDPRAAQIQALEMQKFQQMLNPQGQTPQGQDQSQTQEGVSTPQASDPTQNGNGNIGPGAAPEPNAQGFSGNQEQRPQ